MKSLLPFLFAALAGLTSPVEAAADSHLAKTLGNVAVALTVIYLVALATVCVAWPLLGAATHATPWRSVLARFGSVPWWAYVGGAANVLLVVAGTLTTPVIGAGAYVLILATSALVSGMLLDHLGALGLSIHPLSVLRVLGAALALSGIFVFSRG